MAKKTNQTPAQKVPQRPPVTNTAGNQPPKAPRKGLSQTTILCILLALVSMILYSNTYNGDYVLDDVMVIRDNTMVPKGTSKIGELMSTPHLRGYLNLSNDTYRPLSLVMFAIECQLWGLNPAVNHFFNIVVFAMCVVALFLFLYKLFGKDKMLMAFIASLLFALHPIHTEIVANIKSRDELLCFLFAFVALNFYADYVKTGKVWQLVAAMLSLFLSYLSKETVITFLAIIPLVFFFHIYQGRKKAIFIMGGTVLVTGLFLIIRSVILGKYHANLDIPINFIDNSLVRAPNAASKFATEIWIMGDYLKLLFIPYPLVCDHSFNSIPYVTFANPVVLLTLAAYIGMVVFAVMRLMKDRRDLWAFSIIFFLATISLFTNIIIPLASTMAERFLFFCSLGSCIVMALAIDKWLLPAGANTLVALSKGKVLVVLLPLCLIYASITHARNDDWLTNYTLYKADAAKIPQNTRLNYYMGSELQKQYDRETDPATKKKVNDESMDYLRRSLAIFPDNTDAQAEIGAAYFRANNFDSAEFHLKRALTLNPKQSNAAANLGTMYLNQSKWPEALNYYKMTVRLNPRNAVAQFNGAVCFYQLQQYDSAIQYFKNTIEVAPDFNNYKSFEFTAIVYKTIGKMDSARVYAEKAHEYNPKFQL